MTEHEHPNVCDVCVSTRFCYRKRFFVYDPDVLILIRFMTSKQCEQKESVRRQNERGRDRRNTNLPEVITLQLRIESYRSHD